MDYGQTKQTNQTATPQDFFTVGAGTNNPNSAFDPSDNLDTSNGDWDNPVRHDSKGLGRGALYEAHSDQPLDVTDAINEGVKLGMPPDFLEPRPEPNPNSHPESHPESSDHQLHATEPSREPSSTPIDLSNIKTTKALSATGVQEVSKALDKLDKDAKIADFYDTARQMMEANLENSYGRKIAQ